MTHYTSQNLERDFVNLLASEVVLLSLIHRRLVRLSYLSVPGAHTLQTKRKTWLFLSSLATPVDLGMQILMSPWTFPAAESS
jgi:hypothetical protein